MNENNFEAELKADGYTEIAFQKLDSRSAKGQHGHHFAIRLVLAGSFTVTQDDQPLTYQPGQIFSVALGHPHDESVGPEGAHVIIGRKYSRPENR
jgi:mannose-6-phosphate isomerase-like protein (cupin superfamily)